MRPDGGLSFGLSSRPSVRDCILHGPPTLRMFRPSPPAPTHGLVADESQAVAADTAVIDTDAARDYGGGVDHEDILKSAVAGDQLGCESVIHNPYSRSVRDVPIASVAGSEAAGSAGKFIGASRLPRPQP